MKALSIIFVVFLFLLAGCGKSKKQQETAPTPSVAVDHPQLRARWSIRLSTRGIYKRNKR